MTKKRVFISFDYDHDETLKTFFVGQSRHSDSPFELADWSIKEHLSGDWKKKAAARIGRVDVVAVICGKNTHTATGVSAEVEIVREVGKPYFLLKGYKDAVCTKPTSAAATDTMYNWTWDNLKILIEGGR
ncbi:TIR domain-containing protein [Komagataeibacter oboediens]|uniref:TIR domain-containing protein n=1 Tax=Komagataeibacter oboediens TaxID=65958 RepID=UPI001C2D3F9D|nr:TIR domain-containing protein [Komagataeibacter oboediens]MBV1824832.1 TIR domain-containing protein [Komagataeibacter oboediens]